MSDLPIWVTEIYNAGVASAVLMIIYTMILLFLKEYRYYIRKIVNLMAAALAWAILITETFAQKGLEEGYILFDNVNLFRVAFVVASVALVHSLVDLAEK